MTICVLMPSVYWLGIVYRWAYARWALCIGGHGGFSYQLGIIYAGAVRVRTLLNCPAP